MTKIETLFAVRDQMLEVIKAPLVGSGDIQLDLKEKARADLKTVEAELIKELNKENDVAGLVKLYVQKRDEISALDDEYKKKKSVVALQQEVIEDGLFRIMKETNTKSLRSDFGTVSTTTQSYASVADWTVLLEYIKKNKAWELLKHAVSKDAVKTRIEETKQHVPGVNFEQRLAISVRRK